MSESGLLVTLVEVILREGGGGGKGRDLIWTVLVDAEETDRLTPARWSGEFADGMFFSVVKPSPVLVDVRADGLVGFGGGRFCEFGLDEADDTDVPKAEPAEALRCPSSACVRGSKKMGVPLRGAGAGGATLAEAWLIELPLDATLAGRAGVGEDMRAPSHTGGTIRFLAGGGAGLFDPVPPPRGLCPF